ncbi:hypothetical protein QFC22_001879 [Naganishia vaughanmartiniae]|uniref:Uncharacterized protein n=1 Tax=Naganishia vaughanmartiniae TaxID=1424756 RepID=A0ACC2XEJ3_9TREE|nr:hypothetical protein QFC22_001879 [Naganishia vaughanmartiniae]
MSAVPTVDILLSRRLSSLLDLILAIPSVPPTAYLQVAYLLRFTAAAREWIAGYPLAWPAEYAREVRVGNELSKEEQAQQTVSLLLEFLQALDLGWRKVLRPVEAVGGAISGTRAEALSRTTGDNHLTLTITEKRQQTGGRKGDTTVNRTTQASPSTPASTSANDSDADMSAGYVDAAVDEDGSRVAASGSWAETEEEGVGDWEIAIANSMSGTLELIL